MSILKRRTFLMSKALVLSATTLGVMTTKNKAQAVSNPRTEYPPGFVLRITVSGANNYSGFADARYTQSGQFQIVPEGTSTSISNTTYVTTVSVPNGGFTDLYRGTAPYACTVEIYSGGYSGGHSGSATCATYSGPGSSGKDPIPERIL